MHFDLTIILTDDGYIRTAILYYFRASFSINIVVFTGATSDPERDQSL